MNDKNRVSVIFLSYNQEKFVGAALNSILNQNFESVEIVISDDASVDSTVDIINKCLSDYSGVHDVKLNFNNRNIGLVKNFKKAINISTGDILVMAAGDDISMPYRVSETVRLLDSDPLASFVSFSDVVIDSDGLVCQSTDAKRDGHVRKVSLHDYLYGKSGALSGASRGFRRKYFEVFGELSDDCQTEDSTTLLRLLLIGHGLVSARCGILYRRHNNNLSSDKNINKMNVDNIMNQYKIDIGTAENLGLISGDNLSNIHRWVMRNKERRDVSNLVVSNDGDIKALLIKLFSSRSFSRMEKLGIMKKLVLQKIFT